MTPDHETKDVSGCSNCPFVNEWDECWQPRTEPPGRYTTGTPPPDWCPLRDWPVLVRLVVPK